MRVAIIGYGILGMLAADLLDDPAIEIHIFDLDFQNSGSTFFQELLGPKSLRHPMSSPQGSPGNLDFWGLAISCFIQNPSKWPTGFIKSLKYYRRVLSRYGFSKMPLQTHNRGEVSLRISYANIHKFKSQVFLSQKRSERYRHENLVHSICQKDNQVLVKTFNRMNSPETHVFDHVLICAGPIKSFDLVSTSGLIPKFETVAMNDHPTFWLGEIHVKDSVLVKSRFRNRTVLHGKKPGAIVTSLPNGIVITIRIRPKIFSNIISLSASSKELWLKKMWLLTLDRLGLIFCKKFSVAVSLDYKSHEILASLSESGMVQEFMYASSTPQLSLEVMKQAESTIFKAFGNFQKNWESDSIFEETAAAHYASLLGMLADSTSSSVLEDFHLRQFPRISVPGSVSFPEAVVGHPTYLALCTVIFEVERIKSMMN